MSMGPVCICVYTLHCFFLLLKNICFCEFCVLAIKQTSWSILHVEEMASVSNEM